MLYCLGHWVVSPVAAARNYSVYNNTTIHPYCLSYAMRSDTVFSTSRFMSTQIVQTSTNTKCTWPIELCLPRPKLTLDSNPDFQLIRIRVSSESLPNELDLFHCYCRKQSFRRVSWKAAGGCIRNANRKMPCSATLKEDENWSGIRIRGRITIKS